MSRRNKLLKFSENLSLPNVYENFHVLDSKLLGAGGKEVDIRGRWAERAFGNSNPLTVELACGRGEYSLGLARRDPGRNFLGVDIKGARIWRGAKNALEEGLENVSFLRTRIEQLEKFFHPKEISEIWITFPDPFLKERKANRRLTSTRFQNIYRNLIGKDGVLHLKTDEPVLYEYTLDVLESNSMYEIRIANDDIYSGPLVSAELEIQTYYERMHLEAGKTIKYIQWVFRE
jgi:tRNA (guanine-N7-)-methyltransferase